MVEALRYKLSCFVVTVDGPTEVVLDNKSIEDNLSITTSVLNNKHYDICYHRVRDNQAAGVLLIGWIPRYFNLEYFLQRQLCLGTQIIIWLSQYYRTQHGQLVVLRRRRFICTWAHLSTSHTTRVVAESGC